jgi:diguanylate cyclase (GGDEF)-like protein
MSRIVGSVTPSQTQAQRYRGKMFEAAYNYFLKLSHVLGEDWNEYAEYSFLAKKGIFVRTRTLVAAGFLGTIVLLNPRLASLSASQRLVVVGLIILTLSLALPGWKQIPALMQLVPLASGSLLLFWLIPYSNFGPFYRIEIMLLPLVGAGVFFLPWQKIPRWLHATPVFLILINFVIIRYDLGTTAVFFVPLVVVCLLSLALYNSRIELLIGMVIAGILFVSPQNLTDFNSPEVLRGILYSTLVMLLGVTIQSLVKKSREHYLNLMTVMKIAHKISIEQNPQEARGEICKAALRVSRGNLALLLELNEEGMLVPTYGTQEPLPDLKFSLDGRAFSLDGKEYGKSISEYSVLQAIKTKIAVFRRESVGLPKDIEMMFKQGKIISSLSLPVYSNEKVSGVLTVFWNKRIESISERSMQILTLLANEAALVIQRIDLLGQLNESAHVDEITHIPNRRAWNKELPRAMARAARQGAPLSIAILDLDAFKEFNDTWGHPEGDKLLEEMSGGWNRGLRDVDFIARLGGDEFGLILPNCDEADALRTTQRLKTWADSNTKCNY